MKTYEQANELATSMIDIGKQLGRDVKAEITSMNKPLGRAIGNKNEILEVVETLQGNGPADFVELITSASATILLQSKIFTTEEEAIEAVGRVISNGEALEKFKVWIKAQGGDVDSIFKEDFLKPKYNVEVKAEKKGFLEITSAVAFGITAMKLGAGRESKGDALDNDAGIYLNKKTNEEVNEGDVIFTLSSSNEIATSLVNDLKNAYNINDKTVENKIILGKLG